MSYERSSKIVNFSSLPSPDGYTLENIIATGAYAEVHEATDKSGKKVAVKIIENIKQNIEVIEQEYVVFKKLDNVSNLPEFYGIFLKKEGNENDHQIWFILELITNGTVGDLARFTKKTNNRLSERVISYILGETIVAMKHLHQMRIIHRDIKGPNILVTDDGKIKIVDFGQAAQVNSTFGKRKTSVGTPYWMAPEVIEAETNPDVDYDVRCDVWALGILALELADGEPPYANIHPMRALFQIVRNPPPTPNRMSDWSNEFNDFINECLVKIPDHRPMMIELEEHPFIEKGKENRNQIRQELITAIEGISKGWKKSNKIGPYFEAVSKMGLLKEDRKDTPHKMLTDDLAALENSDENIILETLKARWMNGKIYTWLADVLISINPYCKMDIYNADVQLKYKSKSRSDNDPHIFAVVDRAHQDMMHHKEHQTIVLTGESGGGKTYNFHMCINQLCHIGRSNPALILKVVQSNIILNSLGNAVTQLNLDSTRHVRYYDVTFGTTGKVSGAVIWMLMLEKYRVTHTPRNEGNFHIFYQFYDGLSQTARLARYGLKVGRNYRYLARNLYDNEVANAEKFDDFENALEAFAFTDRQKHCLYLLLSSILNLGNVNFEESRDGVSIVDNEPIAQICRLLELDEKKFTWALCNFCHVQHGSVEPVSKSYKQAVNHRDALARILYSRTVDFVINLINTNFSATRQQFGDAHAIGMLDMFGFEANEHNSLENLLVNICNEQVQYYYNQQVFTWEMQDYEEEGIPTRNFAFPDNRHILELFLTKDRGFISILDSVSRNNQGEDNDFREALKQKVTAKQFQKVSDNSFAIAHYVGRVKYDTRGFVEKNRDYINPELIQTMRKTPNEMIRSLFICQLTKTGNLTVEKGSKVADKGEPKDKRRFNTKSKAKLSQTRHIQTVGLTFKYSLIELLNKLTHSNPHFVRCIRSNMDYSGEVFESDMVKHQIKYHAICDTIKIRQQGFSHRIRYQEFLRRYQFLAFDFDETVDMTKDNARLMLVRLKMEGWAIGNNKVFLKYYNEEFLSRLYETSVKKVIKIQAMMRTFMQIQRKKKGLLKTIDKKSSLSKEDAIIKIQSNLRGHIARQNNPEVMAKLEVGRNSRALQNKCTSNKISSREKYGEDTVESEAVRYIQYYFRKWKLRSIFQALTIYMADRQKKLIYFSQQVHLYSQEVQAKNQRTNTIVDLSDVRDERRGCHNNILNKNQRARGTPKLPLDHTLTAFFDTSYLCDPSRNRVRLDDEWDAPFRTKSPYGQSRAESMCMVDTFTNHCTAPFYPENNYDKGSSTTSKAPPTGYSMNNKSQAPASPVYNKFAGSYLNKKQTAPQPPVNGSSWNNNNETNGNDDDGKRFDFRKNLRKNSYSNAILELKNNTSVENDGSTFNFQGLLRKTGIKEELESVPQERSASPEYDEFGAAIIPPRALTPTFYEQSEEAML